MIVKTKDEQRKMTPFFSIIIPVYNVAPYLRECLDSVLAQTFGDWEAICVDDGSTDGSGAILDEYAAKDARFKVIHQVNAGVSAARNKALDEARGEWVGFLDADDVWANEWLAEIAAEAGEKVEWIRTGWTDWNESSGARKSKQSEINGVDGSFFTKNIPSLGWHLVSRCSFPFLNFYRLNLLRGIYFSLGIRFREDALFCYEVAAKARTLKIVSATGYFRREREGSATFSRRRRDDSIKLLTAYAKLWNDLGLCDRVDPDERGRLLEASTFWVVKDALEWLSKCEDATWKDCFRLASIVRRLRGMGAVEATIRGTRSFNWRWRIFLATGLARILRINRYNLTGRRI